MNRTPERPKGMIREYNPAVQNVRRERPRAYDPEINNTKVLFTANNVKRVTNKIKRGRNEAIVANTLAYNLPRGRPIPVKPYSAPAHITLQKANASAPYPPPGWNIPTWRKPKSRKSRKSRKSGRKSRKN